MQVDSDLLLHEVIERSMFFRHSETTVLTKELPSIIINTFSKDTAEEKKLQALQGWSFWDS